MRASKRALSGIVTGAVVSLLAPGCGTSGTGSQVLDLATKCTAATPGDNSGSGGHFCLTPGISGGDGQDPSSGAVTVANKVLPLCTQLGPKLTDVSPDRLT